MQKQSESLDRKEKRRRQLWTAYAAFLVFWGLNAYSLIFEWIKNNELLARKIDGRPYISDFVNVYNAGVLGRRGRSTNIYDAKVQAALAEAVVAPVKPEMPFYLQTPPNFFVACIPLSFLSPINAWYAYCALGLGLNMAAMGALARKYFEAPFARAFVLIGSLGCFPMWSSIEQGNSSLYLLPPLVLYWWLLQNKRYFSAGLATGLLMVKVQYLPFIGLIGIAIGGMRYLAGSLIAAIAVLGTSIAVLGIDNVLEWPRILMHAETATNYSGVAADKMQNLRGAIAALTGHVDTKGGQLVADAAFIAAALAVVALWRKPYQILRQRSLYAFEICAAISIGAMLIFSIHTHSHDYIIWLISCVWLYVAARRETSDDKGNYNRLAMAAVVFPGITWPLFLLTQIPVLPFQPIATFTAALVVYAALLWFPRKPQDLSDIAG